MLSSYVSFTCVAVEPGLFSAYWILSYETPETKPLRPVAGIDRTVSSMHQRVQQTSIMHGMDTLFTRTLRSRKIWFYQDTKSSSCLLNHTSLSIFELFCSSHRDDDDEHNTRHDEWCTFGSHHDARPPGAPYRTGPSGLVPVGFYRVRSKAKKA